MKRYGILFCILTFGLIFSTAAQAVDLKVGGEYFAGGMYLDKTMSIPALLSSILQNSTIEIKP